MYPIGFIFLCHLLVLPFSIFHSLFLLPANLVLFQFLIIFPSEIITILSLKSGSCAFLIARRLEITNTSL